MICCFVYSNFQYDLLLAYTNFQYDLLFRIYTNFQYDLLLHRPSRCPPLTPFVVGHVDFKSFSEACTAQQLAAAPGVATTNFADCGWQTAYAMLVTRLVARITAGGVGCVQVSSHLIVASPLHCCLSKRFQSRSKTPNQIHRRHMKMLADDTCSQIGREWNFTNGTTPST